VRRRLRRLEQRAGPLYDVVVCLKDGTRARFVPDARLEAFHAEMAGEEHPLLDLLPLIDLEASPELRAIVEFLRAFRGDEERETHEE
jgi:hypothetical protein